MNLPERNEGYVELVERMLSGALQPLSRLISLVERGYPAVTEIMKDIYPRLGRAYSIGITGPPGGGKSTLVDRLTAVARSKGLSVGIIAVDPTSPFSGGAVLGDRIRMQQHYLDPAVFIRSMATRGSRGGLPTTTRNVMQLLDAFGKDIIFVETVGVGQTELDIMETVDTTLVALVPEAGDAIQTMKAGLMEIADIFVVNKADRPGADRLAVELESMLMLSPRMNQWQPPILATQAINEVGIEALYREVERHQEFLESSGELLRRRRQQRKEEFLHAVEHRLRNRLSLLMSENERLRSLLGQVENGEIDPYSAVEIMESEVLSRGWLPGVGQPP
ncbi:methylmalonyl Co-A mutase-associated GTPase MeaB [Dehalococcoidia bacterium]|nr:methylmalonyl Co-A mutase-associated GTPase MeaB [Dehalococcoidia bacterium]MCL0102670.1 methylmalonyl Co-A mutase-associated GTPase MeaB [Dehalococcoidia bacterium]